MLATEEVPDDPRTLPGPKRGWPRLWEEEEEEGRPMFLADEDEELPPLPPLLLLAALLAIACPWRKLSDISLNRSSWVRVLGTGPPLLLPLPPVALMPSKSEL